MSTPENLQSYEVYQGFGGIWTRVILAGSGGSNTEIIKTSADFIRATIIETSQIINRLNKAASDNVRVSILETSAVVSTGTTTKSSSDTLAVRTLESTAQFITLSASDTVVVGIVEVITYPGTDYFPGTSVFPAANSVVKG